MKLKPDYYYDSIFEIPYPQLYELGLRGLIFDIDNTLAGYENIQPPVKTLSLIYDLKQMGFQVGLLSNNGAKRVDAFNAELGLPSSASSAKPFTKALARIMREMNVSQGECAIIGDQILSDIWCGKNAGIATILVKPVTEHEVITVRIKAVLENRLRKRYLSGHTNPL